MEREVPKLMADHEAELVLVEEFDERSGEREQSDVIRPYRAAVSPMDRRSKDEHLWQCREIQPPCASLQHLRKRRRASSVNPQVIAEMFGSIRIKGGSRLEPVPFRGCRWPVFPESQRLAPLNERTPARPGADWRKFRCLMGHG
jgi:hypothetical protein